MSTLAMNPIHLWVSLVKGCDMAIGATLERDHRLVLQSHLKVMHVLGNVVLVLLQV